MGLAEGETVAEGLGLSEAVGEKVGEVVGEVIGKVVGDRVAIVLGLEAVVGVEGSIGVAFSATWFCWR